MAWPPHLTSLDDSQGVSTGIKCGGWRQIAKKIVVLFAGFFIVLSPWIIRNQLAAKQSNATIVPRAGQTLFSRVYFMESLYPDIYKYFVGHAVGYYFAEKIFPGLDSKAFVNFRPQAEIVSKMRSDGYSLDQIDNILLKESVNKILRQPHKYLLYSVLDLIAFNGPTIPQRLFGGNDNMHFTFAGGRWARASGWIKASAIIFVRVVWALFLFLFIYGLAKNFKNWAMTGTVALLVFYFNAIHAAVHATPRFAMMVLPFYFIFAAAGFSLIRAKFGISGRLNLLFQRK